MIEQTVLSVLRSLVDEARIAFQLSNQADTEGAPRVSSALARLGGELVYDAQRLVAKHEVEVSYLHQGRTGVIKELDEHAPTEWLRIWDERNATHATVQWHEVAEVAA